jgi:hypothetical protein
MPSQSLVRDLLRNPFYAGAYVWGRRPVETVLVDGRLEKRQRAMRQATECRVFLPAHHEGYIDWATYEENQRMIRRNSATWQRDDSMPAIRTGQGLLVGQLRCGHCGRKLHVHYWGAHGTHARYLCKGDFDDGGQYCIGFGGVKVTQPGRVLVRQAHDEPGDVRLGARATGASPFRAVVFLGNEPADTSAGWYPV